MEKPPPSRMNIIASIAAAMGMMHIPSTAAVLQKQRGKAPSGKRFISTSVYMPGGPRCNVQPAKIRNPKIAAHVAMMHDKWYAKKFGGSHV